MFYAPSTLNTEPGALNPEPGTLDPEPRALKAPYLAKEVALLPLTPNLQTQNPEPYLYVHLPTGRSLNSASPKPSEVPEYTRVWTISF